MKVILWAPFGAGTHYWGPGTSAYRLYKTLKDDGVKVTLVHGSDSQGHFPEVYDEQIKISTLEGKGKLASVLFLIKSFFWIKNNYHKYDAFHGITAFYYTFLPALYFNKFKGYTFIKVTGSNGGFGNNSLISRVSGLSKFRLSKLNSISGYISISSYISANLIKVGVDEYKIFDIPNGVDTNRFKEISKETKQQARQKKNIPDKFTLAYIGGLTENKRVVNIIHAANILKNKGVKDFQVLIVGPDRSDGITYKKIKDLIKNFNLTDYVVYVNHTEEPEVYFQLSDVFMLVSKSEGLSNSLLEAMSCGLPAIVTEISGSEDLIKDGVNGLYTDATPEDIARCIDYFILNKHKIADFGAKNRDIIIENYSNSFIISQHIKMFSGGL